ncbi:hypothetical protein HDV05_007734 [Chytridiales sp. JEL 0842]|nr:hypothetical protein HDV05_007734 [Chytridiales sp. JEL 0842]
MSTKRAVAPKTNETHHISQKPSQAKAIIGWVKPTTAATGKEGQNQTLLEAVRPVNFVENEEFKTVLQDVISKESYKDVGLQSELTN